MKHRDVRRLMQGPTASIQPRASILAPESTRLTTTLICLLRVNEWMCERMTAALGPFVNEATPYNGYGLRALRWMFLEVSYHITRKCLQGLRVAYRKPNSHSSPCHSGYRTRRTLPNSFPALPTTAPAKHAVLIPASPPVLVLVALTWTPLNCVSTHIVGEAL